MNIPSDAGYYLVKTWCYVKYIEVVRQLDTKKLVVIHEGNTTPIEKWFELWMVKEWVRARSPHEMWADLFS